jgi:phage-related protein
MTWKVQFLDNGVRAALESLPSDIQAKFLRISRLIAAHGLPNVHEPYVKHLEGRLWEMRMKGRDGIARAAYVTAAGHRVVVVHVFVKKTEKTLRHEIETALRRAKEVE